MKQRRCKNCSHFRQYYYKGRKRLMPSGIGRCVKEYGNPVEVKEVCESYEERNDNITLLRRQNIENTLLKLFEETNELLHVLISDKTE